MNDSEQIRELLTQIRDCHRESLEIQKEAVERQRRFMALYRVVLIVGGVLMGAILLVHNRGTRNLAVNFRSWESSPAASE